MTEPVFYRGESNLPPKSLSVRPSVPLLHATGRLRALRRRLTAGVWSQTDEPYLLLEVPEDEFGGWAPGFEVALDGFVEHAPNPYAAIERYDDMIVLLVQGQGFWAPPPFTHWPWNGPCEVLVIAKGRLAPDGGDRENALQQLVTAGHALFSVVDITAPDCLAGF